MWNLTMVGLQYYYIQLASYTSVKCDYVYNHVNCLWIFHSSISQRISFEKAAPSMKYTSEILLHNKFEERPNRTTDSCQRYFLGRFVGEIDRLPQNSRWLPAAMGETDCPSITAPSDPSTKEIKFIFIENSFLHFLSSMNQKYLQFSYILFYVKYCVGSKIIIAVMTLCQSPTVYLHEQTTIPTKKLKNHLGTIFCKIICQNKYLFLFLFFPDPKKHK